MPLDSTHEVVWSNQPLSAGAQSAPISIAVASRVRLMGHASQQTSFDILFGTTSNGTFYKSEFTIQVGGDDDFSLAFSAEVSYLKIRCNDAATVTLILVKKITSLL